MFPPSFLRYAGASPPSVKTNRETGCVNRLPFGTRDVEMSSEERAMTVDACERKAGGVERVILELGPHESLHERFASRLRQKERVLRNVPFAT
jgi:hypothetical protein